MVTTLGNNIINAYTGGVQVKEIYSFGVKVWPVSTPGPANDEIWYTTYSGNQLTLHDDTGFGANLVSNTYDSSLGVYVLKFDNIVTKSGAHAFSQLSDLRNVYLPSSVTVIDIQSFYYSGLYSIEMPGVETIGGMAFMGCSSLNPSLTIPSTCTTMGSLARIGTSLMYIGQCFDSCTSLTEVTIPASCTLLYNGIFNGCINLSTVIVEATTPPELKQTTSTGEYTQFKNCSSNLQIKVPASSLNAYLTAPGWSTYASYIVAMPDDSIDFSELGLATATSVDYDDYGYFASGNLKITFSSTTSTKSRYYTGGTAVRIYGGNTMSIESFDPSITFKKIEFTWTGTASTSYKPDTDVATPSGYDYQTYVWTGNSGTVEMTRPTGSGGHWRIKAVSVWYS